MKVICNVIKRKAHHILYALQGLRIPCIKAEVLLSNTAQFCTFLRVSYSQQYLPRGVHVSCTIFRGFVMFNKCYVSIK